jgi:hypothetical protein
LPLGQLFCMAFPVIPAINTTDRMNVNPWQRFWIWRIKELQRIAYSRDDFIVTLYMKNNAVNITVQNFSQLIKISS